MKAAMTNQDPKILIDLEDLLDVMDWHSEGLDHYLDLKTGDVVLYHKELGEREEGDPPEPAWQREQREMNRAIDEAAGGRYIFIEPVSSDDNYRRMEDFAESVRDPRLREELFTTLRGKGAFRRFKDALWGSARDAWHRYERDRLMEYAKEWLDSLKVAYELKGPTDPGP